MASGCRRPARCRQTRRFPRRPTLPCPCGMFTVMHKLRGRGDQPVRLLIAVQRIGEVVGAVDEQDRTTHAGQIARRVEVRDPALAHFGRTSSRTYHAPARRCSRARNHSHRRARPLSTAGSMPATMHVRYPPQLMPVMPMRSADPPRAAKPAMHGRADGGHGLIGPHVGQAVVVEGAKLAPSSCGGPPLVKRSPSGPLPARSMAKAT